MPILRLLPLLLVGALVASCGDAADRRLAGIERELSEMSKRLEALERAEQGRVGLTGVIGVWSLDRSAFEKELLRVQGPVVESTWPATLDEAGRTKARRELEATIREAARNAEMTLTLEPDGSFELRSDLDDAPQTASGTWTLEERTLTLVETHANGSPRQETSTSTGTLSSGALRFETEDGGTMTLRKR